MSSALTERTRLVFVATPNNPTGLVVPRGELIAFLRDLPSTCSRSSTRRTSTTSIPSSRFDSIAEIVQPGGDALVLRTFSKLYGLAGPPGRLRVGPEAVIAAMRKVQRGYDVGSLAQVAALASLADADEVERRRGANRAAVEALVDLLRAHGLEPLAGTASRTSCSSTSATTRTRLADELLAQRRRRSVGGAVRCSDGAADRCRVGGRPRAARRRPRRCARSRTLGRCKPDGDSAGASAILAARALGARFPMRTTLKRGVGRGHSEPGNGKMQLPPELVGPDHDLPPARAAAAEPPLARADASSAGLRWSSSSAASGVAGGAYLYLHEIVAAVAPKSVDVKVTAKRLDLPVAGQPATALVIGYDRRAERGQERAVALGHADARARQPEERDDLAALVPARPACRDRLPGQARRTRARSTPRTRTAARRARSRRCASSPASRSTT